MKSSSTTTTTTKTTSPRNLRRSLNDDVTAHDYDQIVILLPDPRVLRVIARSVLLAAALLSFPWLRTMLVLSGSSDLGNDIDTEPKWVDCPFTLRMLVADLKREGLFRSELRNVFIGDPGSRARFLKRNGMDLMRSEYSKMMVEDNSVDFVLAADGLGDSALGFVDRVLRVGGIATVRLGSDPCRLPLNYRMAYIRRFGSTVVAMKKIARGKADEFKGGGGSMSRKLLTATVMMKFNKDEQRRRGFGMDYPAKNRKLKFKEELQGLEKNSEDNAGELKGDLPTAAVKFKDNDVLGMDYYAKNWKLKFNDVLGMDYYAKNWKLKFIELQQLILGKAHEGNAGELKSGLLMIAEKFKEDEHAKNRKMKLEAAIRALKKINEGNANELKGGLKSLKTLVS